MPTIDKVTGITNSATMIDNIFTNQFRNTMVDGIVVDDVT